MLFYQGYVTTIANGAIIEANVYGKFVSILTWASAIDLQISIEGQNFSPIKAGMSVRLPDIAKPFYLIRFWNNTGGAVVLEYAVSDGSIVDSRLAVAGIIPIIIPGLAVSNYGITPCLAAAGGTLVIAANAARRSFLIQNLLANGGNHYIGFDALLTNVNYGTMLLPGAAYINTDYTGDVWVQSTVNLEAVSFIEV